MKDEQLEQLALVWFQDAGREYRHGPEIAPDGHTPERDDYRHVLLPARLNEALHRLNPGVPDSTKCCTRLPSPAIHSLTLNNRAFHEALLDGVPLEVESGGREVPVG